MATADIGAAYDLLPSGTEAYRFINLKSLLSSDWQAAVEPNKAISAPAETDIVPTATTRLVFINGLFQGDSSQVQTGIKITQLDEAGGAESSDTFAEINRALTATTIAIKLSNKIADNSIVSLMHYSTDASAGTMTHPRILIDADQGTKATIVQHFTGHSVKYATNVVTRMVLAGGTDIRHYRIQRESAQAVHLATTQIEHTGPDAIFHSLSVNLGASLFRHDLDVKIKASNVDSTHNGIVLLDDQQISDTHSRFEHLHPASRSNELYKCVLDDKAHSIFRGRIYVDQKAQKTDAFQSNPNMLLSDDAVANSNPELEIYADDVRCTHGATCGDIEDEALFYLRSRGFGKEQARQLLIYAFLSELVDAIEIPELQEMINLELLTKLEAHSE